MKRLIDNTCTICNKPVPNFSCGETNKHCTTKCTTDPCCPYEAGLEPWDICPCYHKAINAIDE